MGLAKLCEKETRTSMTLSQKEYDRAFSLETHSSSKTTTPQVTQEVIFMYPYDFTCSCHQCKSCHRKQDL